jgi:hypothetical protein
VTRGKIPRRPPGPQKCSACGGGIAPCDLATEFCGLWYHYGCDSDWTPFPPYVMQAIFKVLKEETDAQDLHRP